MSETFRLKAGAPSEFWPRIGSVTAGVLALITAAGTLAYQAALWLKLGFWTPIDVGTVLRMADIPTSVSWSTSLQGLNAAGQWLLTCPASAVLSILGSALILMALTNIGKYLALAAIAVFLLVVFVV